MSDTVCRGIRPQAELDELMRLQESMPEDVDRLVGLLSDENELVREAAAWKLRDNENVDPSVFMDMLGNQTAKVRSRGALELGFRKVRAAVPALIALLDSERLHGVRCCVASSLSCIGGRAALDRLMEALGDEDPSIRLSACHAFRWRKTRRALPRMRLILMDPDFSMRWCAVRYLVSLREADDRLLETAEQLLTDPEFLARQAGSKESEAEIRAFLDNPEEVRKLAEESGRTVKDTRDHYKWVLRLLQRDREKERAKMEQLVERAKQLAAGENA